MERYDQSQHSNPIINHPHLTHFFLPGAIVVDYASFSKTEIERINSALMEIESYVCDCKKEELTGFCEWYDWEILIYSTHPEANQVGPIGKSREGIPLCRLPNTFGNGYAALSDIISIAIDNLLDRHDELIPLDIDNVHPFILVISADDFIYSTPPSLFTKIYGLNATNQLKVYCATRCGEYPESVSSYFWNTAWRKPLPLVGIDLQRYLEAHALYSGEAWRDELSTSLLRQSESEDTTCDTLCARAITLSL